jgi:hypothetical protein
MKLRSTSLVLGATLVALAAASVADSASAQRGSDRAAASRSVRLSHFRKPTLSIKMRSARLRTGSTASTQPSTGRLRSLGRIGGGNRLVVTGLAAWQERRAAPQVGRGVRGGVRMNGGMRRR